jgi:hypothetical protein
VRRRGRLSWRGKDCYERLQVIGYGGLTGTTEGMGLFLGSLVVEIYLGAKIVTINRTY